MNARMVKAKLSAKVQNDSSGSLNDGKDSSGSDNSKNLTTKLQPKVQVNDGKLKILPKSRVVSSRYKEAAIEATRKGLSNSSDSSKTRSPLDKNRKISKLTAGASRSPNFLPVVGLNGNSNLRLHSTAVNSSTFFEKTRISSPEEFSTTIVGGQNRFRQPNSLYLSDISDIQPSVSSTVVGAPVNKESKTEQKKQYTSDDLKKEYLEFLTWMYIDKRSEEAIDKQVKEAQNQLSVLSQLLEQEETKTSEVKQKLELLNQYEKASRYHELLKEELVKLNETVEPCKNTIEDLAHHLEHQMNQIKLENVYIPSDEAQYKELLTEALRDNYNTLVDLNSNVRDSKEVLQSAADLFKDVVKESEKIETCLVQGEKVATLAIQESSLKLSQRKVSESENCS